MRRIASWTTAAVAATLLAGSLGGAPAYADTPQSATIAVRYAGKASTATVTDPSTVGAAITQLHLAVDGNDRVAPGRSTAVTDGMSLVVDVVTVKRSTRKQTVRYKYVHHKTASLMKGHIKVVRRGIAGKTTRTSVTTTVNGRSTTVVTTKVTRKVRNQVVKVGTSRLNLARMTQWNRIARCESGGNWRINTGNGYYGGLQFNLATWRAAGGSKFAKYPHQATQNEQVHVANTLYAKRGFAPWSCRP